MRKTHATVQVTLALMANPDGCHWGAETWKRSGVRSGAMYPILWRMLDLGWLADGWEDTAKARAEKRPPRRYYKITPAGKTELAALLDEARGDPRFQSLFAAKEANR
jgi:PadR family transcriptional regulator